MIIWSRWGILVMLFVGLGVGLGFIINRLAGVPHDTGPTVGLYIGLGLVLSSVLLFVTITATVGKVIDKPRPVVVWQQLAQPMTLEDGTTVTRRPVPVTDPDTGEQLWTTPTSSLFFIPVRFWPYVLAGIGVVLIVINLIELQAQP